MGYQCSILGSVGFEGRSAGFLGGSGFGGVGCESIGIEGSGSGADVLPAFGGVDVVALQSAGPIILIFSASWLYFQYFGFQTAVFAYYDLLRHRFVSDHLLLKNPIDFSIRHFVSEMFFDQQQPFLFLPLLPLLLDRHVGDGILQSLDEFGQQEIPGEEFHLHSHPIFSIQLVYFLKFSLGVGHPALLAETHIDHLLESLPLEVAVDPLRLLRVDQQSLPFETIISEFADVHVSVGEVAFPEVLQPASAVESSFYALEFEWFGEIFEFFLVDFEFHSHALKNVTVIDIADYNFPPSFHDFESVLPLHAALEGEFVSAVHHAPQTAAEDFLEEFAVGFDYLFAQSSGLVDQMVQFLGLVVNEYSAAVGGIALVEGQFQDALSRPDGNFVALSAEEDGDNCVFAEHDVVAGHGVVAVVAEEGGAVVQQQQTRSVAFVGVHAAHVDAVAVVHEEAVVVQPLRGCRAVFGGGWGGEGAFGRTGTVGGETHRVQQKLSIDGCMKQYYGARLKRFSLLIGLAGWKLSEYFRPVGAYDGILNQVLG